MFGSPNSAETSYSSYVTNQQEILTKAYKKSLRKHQTKTAQTKKFYNHRVHGKPYKGNLVWLFNPAVEKGYTKNSISHGVDPIGSATNCLMLTIKHTANNKIKVVHFHRLKHCPNGTRFTHKKRKDASPSNPIQLSQPPGFFSLEVIEDDSDTFPPFLLDTLLAAEGHPTGLHTKYGTYS